MSCRKSQWLPMYCRKHKQLCTVENYNNQQCAVKKTTKKPHSNILYPA